ncbi:Opsin-1 [Blattella germanica]|nr:Opsin-1 [Blattella germanica]
MSATSLMMMPHMAAPWQIAGNASVVDSVPPEMLHLVDAHWYQYPPLNPLWHGILGFVIAVLGFISWTGNGMVIYIFSSTKSLRTPSNLLVVNLAFSDFLMMVIISPPMVVNCYNETWVLGPLMCEIYGMCGSLFGCASIWTMTLIALDRYNVIVKGLAAKPMTVKTALLRIVIVWLFALAWTIMPLFGWNSRSYILVYSVFVYYLPLFTIIYSYWFIVQAVAAHEKQMREQAKKMNVASLRSSEQSNTSAECKLAKVALMTISLWFMAWTPYLVINYMGVLEGAKISPLATIWGSLFAKANAVYNPIVYGISHPKYRAVLKEKLPFLVCGQTENDATSQASANSTATATESAEKA